MNAAEIIELIKKLPPEERAVVEAYLRGEKTEMRVEEGGVSYLPQDEAERRARRIFAENRELFRRLAQ
jgi:hypothetical protein